MPAKQQRAVYDPTAKLVVRKHLIFNGRPYKPGDPFKAEGIPEHKLRTMWAAHKLDVVRGTARPVEELPKKMLSPKKVAPVAPESAADKDLGDLIGSDD